MAELKDRLRADLTESIRTGNELRTGDDSEDRWCHTTPRLAGDDCRPPYSAPHFGDPVEPFPRGVADGEDAGEDTAPAAGFTGRSPGFLVAVARLLGLHAEGSSSVRLVALTEPALAPVPVEVAWSLTTVEEYPTEVGPLPVERYETVDLASGQRATVHLAGDVVLAATGVELDALDTPPTLPSGKSR